MILPDLIELKPKQKANLLPDLENWLQTSPTIAQGELQGPFHQHEVTIKFVNAELTVNVPERHRVIQVLNPDGTVSFVAIPEADIDPSQLPHASIHKAKNIDNAEVEGNTLPELEKTGLIFIKGYDTDNHKKVWRSKKSKLAHKGNPHYAIPKNGGWSFKR